MLKTFLCLVSAAFIQPTLVVVNVFLAVLQVPLELSLAVTFLYTVLGWR